MKRSEVFNKIVVLTTVLIAFISSSVALGAGKEGNSAGIEQNMADSMVKMVQETIYTEKVGPLSMSVLLETALPEFQWDVFRGKGRRGLLKVQFRGKITPALHEHAMRYIMKSFGTVEKFYKFIMGRVNDDLNALKRVYPDIDPKDKRMVCAKYLTDEWIAGDYILIEWPFYNGIYAGEPHLGGFEGTGEQSFPMFMIRLVNEFVMNAN